MNVLFLYNGAENLGVEYLSSFLKSQGHNTYLLFDPAIFSGGQLIDNRLLSKIFSKDDKIVKKAVEFSPDLVAFSTFTGNYNWCLKIAKRIKEKINVPIVFGGVHTSAVPREVLSNDFVNYIIVGEGEDALLDLIDYLKLKKDVSKVPNLGYKLANKVHINSPREYIKDLDKLPFPDKNLFYDKVPVLQESYSILTSRGCPFNCTYCSNSMYHKLYCDEGKPPRGRRSPKNVIEELKWAKSKWNIKSVTFIDDVFTSSKQWLEEFIPLYKSEINIPFSCLSHPNTMSKEIAQLLKSGGCWLIIIGVQSGSRRIREDIFNRYGSNERILESIRYVKEAGIKISLDNIFGAPTEEVKDLEMGLSFYKEAKPDRIFTFWLTYYPNTKIIDIAKEHNCISENEIHMINKGFTGFTHSWGSIKGRKRKMYLKYELLFQLVPLFNDGLVYRSVSKISSYLPFKPILIKMVIFLNAIKNRDMKLFYTLKYLWAPKKIP